MSTPDEVLTAAPAYPDDAYHWFYGRRVWELGEGGEEGVMVQGDDRRTWAALNAYARGQGIVLRTTAYHRPKVQWVAEFATTCGCTVEDHAWHVAEDLDCVEPECAREGLPPCGDRYAWSPEYADVPGEPAVPVLVVDW